MEYGKDPCECTLEILERFLAGLQGCRKLSKVLGHVHKILPGFTREHLTKSLTDSTKHREQGVKPIFERLDQQGTSAQFVPIAQHLIARITHLADETTNSVSDISPQLCGFRKIADDNIERVCPAGTQCRRERSHHHADGLDI